MRPFSLRRLALVLTIVAGTTLLGGTPVSAQGPSETLKVTTTHKIGTGQNVTCTLRFTIITHYQNNATTDLARYSITNNAQCRNATFTQNLTWVPPAGGSATVTNYFGGDNLIPAVSQFVYSPVAKSAAKATFTETTGYYGFTWDDCRPSSNCSVMLTLTADGAA